MGFIAMNAISPISTYEAVLMWLLALRVRKLKLMPTNAVSQTSANNPHPQYPSSRISIRVKGE